MIVLDAISAQSCLTAASAVGPHDRFGPDYGNSRPAAANLELAMDMGKYVNSFRWRGDRYGRP